MATYWTPPQRDLFEPAPPVSQLTGVDRRQALDSLQARRTAPSGSFASAPSSQAAQGGASRIGRCVERVGAERRPLLGGHVGGFGFGHAGSSLLLEQGERGKRPQFRGWKVEGDDGAACAEPAKRGTLGDAHAKRSVRRQPRSRWRSGRGDRLSRGQRSDDHRGIVVVASGVSGLLGIIGVEGDDVIGDLLRFGRRMEDLPAVLLKHFNP